MEIFHAFGVVDVENCTLQVSFIFSILASGTWLMNTHVIFVPIQDQAVVLISETKLICGFFVTYSYIEVGSSGELSDMDILRFVLWHEGNFVAWAVHLINIYVLEVHQPLSLQVQ